MSEHVLYSRVSKSDVAMLYGHSNQTINTWLEEGCPQNADGSFSLWRVVKWREKHLAKKLREKMDIRRVRQDELGRLLSVSRQTIHQWNAAGMIKLRDAKGQYSLPRVMAWLRCHYQAQAEKKYKKRVKTLQSTLSRAAK